MCGGNGDIIPKPADFLTSILLHFHTMSLTATQVNHSEVDQLALDPSRIPAHVAIIMDGNGRWATGQGKARLFGHWQGYRTLKDIVYAADDLGVRFLTVDGFSSENWRRPDEEVGGLMELMLTAIQDEIDELMGK